MFLPDLCSLSTQLHPRENDEMVTKTIWETSHFSYAFNDAMCAFDGGETPVDYVDELAKKIKLRYCPANQQEEK